MKMVATGLIYGRKSFFRVGWNYVDLFIIITGLLFSLVPPLRKEKACSIITMFRSIKLAYATTPMRRMMTSWLQAFRKMANVFAVLIFFILVFAATGIGEFGANRYYRCRMTPEPVDGVWEADESILFLCNGRGYGSYDCPSGRYCGNPYDVGLKATDAERYGSELVFYGAPGYENILRGFLFSFQVVTCDDWSKLMFRMQDSDDSILSRIFFPCFVFIGSFLCMNLIVAVIVDTFQSNRENLRNKDSSKGDKVGEIGDSQEGLKGDNSNLQEQQDASSEFIGKVIENKIEEIKDDEVNAQEASPYLDKEESTDKITLKATAHNAVQVHEAHTKKKRHDSVIRIFCRLLKQHKMYNNVIMILVIFNFIILALNRKGISDTERTVYDVFDTILVVIFFIEMFIDLIALGCKKYFTTKYADIVMNILGIIELVLTWSSSFDGTLYSPS